MLSDFVIVCSGEQKKNSPFTVNPCKYRTNTISWLQFALWVDSSSF